MSQIWLQLALVAALVVINGLLAGSEIALVSLREGQLRKLERRGGRARLLARLARDPNRFLATIQVGITLAGFLASAAAAVTLARPLVGLLEWMGDLARPMAIIVVTAILTYFTLVLGELAPKRVALQRAEGWGLVAARPLSLFATLAHPVVWLLERSTDVAVRFMGGDPSVQRDEMTEEELHDLLVTRPGFSRLQREILSGAFEITGRRLKEVAVARPDVLFVSADDDASTAVERLLSSGHSRAPVVDGSVDNVVGIVHLRDLIASSGPVREHMREAPSLPEMLEVINALRELQRSRQQMALVIDEHGGVEGIVTIEDLLEELVGEIYDEFDRDIGSVDRRPDGSLGIPGSFPVHDLDDLDVNLPEGDYTTVAGVMLDHLGRLPEVGETIEVSGWQLRADDVSDRAIERVSLRRVPNR